MLIVLEDLIDGKLRTKLLRDEVTLHLDSATTAMLYAHMQPGDHTYITIHNAISKEVAKLTMTCGQFILLRGIGVAPPSAYPAGSCISFALTSHAAKELPCGGGT